MGTFKEETGKTRVGKFLEKVAPTVLDVAGELTGVDALKKLGDLIVSSDEMTEGQKTFALETLRLDIDDRKSAREMQITALQQDDIFSKRFTYYLSAFIFVMFSIFMILLFFVKIPDGNSEIIYMAFGTFIGIAGTVAAYHYGSSLGSKDKDNGIMKALQGRKR